MHRLPRFAHRTRVVATVAAVAAAFSLIGGPGPLSPLPLQRRSEAAEAPSAVIRVDQVGYTTSSSKSAYLMTATTQPALPFSVLDGNGTMVASGVTGASRGAWNSHYVAVYPLDFSALATPGYYHVIVGTLGVTSPTFRVETPATLWAPRVADVTAFFQAQRDGAAVVLGDLERKPAHRNDRAAAVYEKPRFEDSDSDVIVGSSLQPTGAHVDVEGGWFDAGDFVKFAHTTAYADILLAVAARRLGPAAPRALTREIVHGRRWLAKAWQPEQGCLVFQVGIGSGNTAGTFNGDHDLWRLPQRDDHLKGAANRYLRHRPAFCTTTARGELAPNLAGRLSAAFALAAQRSAARDRPIRARRQLGVAADIFSRARTTGVRPRDVVTALPKSFYPEASWRDDLQLGAAELARAAYRLGDPRAAEWLRAGDRYALDYQREEAGDATLNLYDVSALADYELATMHRLHPKAPGHVRPLVRDLQRQVANARSRSDAEPFRLAADDTDYDVASHTYGLAASALMLRRLTGRTTYDEFAARQLDWTFGANPWGVTMMIGVGTSYPRCPQHVVANLSGGRDGTPPLLLGAVVNGPNSAELFDDGLGEFFDNAPACPSDTSDAYAVFTGHGSRFVDDVRSWQTVEPALDFSASAALALALAAKTT